MGWYYMVYWEWQGKLCKMSSTGCVGKQICHPSFDTVASCSEVEWFLEEHLKHSA